MKKHLLHVKKLTKIFETKRLFRTSKKFVAVDDISFELKEGEILGFLGPNGAGKTTTIQMLLGLLTPTSGSIQYFDKDFFKNRSEIMEKVSFVSPYLKLPGSLTIREILTVYSQIYDVTKNIKNERIEKNLHFFGIWEIQDRPIKNLSAGQLTRLMLAKAFLPNPKIVLLDEPTAALDPDIAVHVRKFIVAEKKLGTSILLTSHNMAEVEEVCDRVLVLKEGKIIATETPEKLAATVKTSHLQLLVSNIETASTFAQEKNLKHKIDGHFIEFELDEQKIPELLFSIMQSNIKYTEISIKKPTLEDYFLSISGSRKQQ